jgi:hypothetical protein
VLSSDDVNPVLWDNVSLGDTVYIDNYQHGARPKANPRIGGPFKVVRGNGCGRCLQNIKGSTFMHYPEDLAVLRKSDAPLPGA